MGDPGGDDDNARGPCAEHRGNESPHQLRRGVSHHILLTPEGAVESRSVRRLPAEEQWSGDAIVNAKRGCLGTTSPSPSARGHSIPHVLLFCLTRLLFRNLLKQLGSRLPRRSPPQLRDQSQPPQLQDQSQPPQLLDVQQDGIVVGTQERGVQGLELLV